MNPAMMKGAAMRTVAHEHGGGPLSGMSQPGSGGGGDQDDSGVMAEIMQLLSAHPELLEQLEAEMGMDSAGGGELPGGPPGGSAPPAAGPPRGPPGGGGGPPLAQMAQARVARRGAGR